MPPPHWGLLWHNAQHAVGTAVHIPHHSRLLRRDLAAADAPPCQMHLRQRHNIIRKPTPSATVWRAESMTELGESLTVCARCRAPGALNRDAVLHTESATSAILLCGRSATWCESGTSAMGDACSAKYSACMSVLAVATALLLASAACSGK